MTIDEAATKLVESLSHLSIRERELVERATDVAIEAHKDQRRDDGSPYAVHAIEVASILAEWQTDGETIAAGLLHDTLEDTPLSEHDIRSHFGHTVADLVVGVTKFTQADFVGYEHLERKIETLRKLFEVMRSDMRVALIKLADRLHNVRTIETLQEERRGRFARETLRVYHPIAYHLGMNDLRREFSERCMPLAHPDEAREMNDVRMNAMRALERMLPGVEKALKDHDDEDALLSLSVRPRELYSLFRHRRRGEETQETAYIVAFARNVDACYAVLKLLHTVYKPISGKFRDYIAAQDSAYQSLHTTVIGPGDHLIPFRIRTEEMDLRDRQGILRTWFVLKEKPNSFSWLERSRDLDLFTRDSSERFWDAIESDIFHESIAVTVDGTGVTVPVGATSLDAAYAALGRKANRIESLTVNGIDRSFGTQLQEEAVIQIHRSAFPQVKVEWLQSVTTKYARSLIVESLKERDQTEKVAIGYRMLQHELDHFERGLISDITRTKREEVALHFRRSHFDDVVSMIGEGVLDAREVIFLLFPEKSRFWFLPASSAPSFKLRVTGTEDLARDALSQVSTLAHMHGVTISNAHIAEHRQKGTFDLTTSGSASDRIHLADFIDALERQEGISRVTTFMSPEKKLQLSASLLLASLIILTDILLLPSYHRWIEDLTFLPPLLLDLIPIVPILGANHYLLSRLKRATIWLRTSRWFLGLGLLMNLVGIVLILSYQSYAGQAIPSLIPFIAAFVLSMFYLGYRFFQTESAFTVTHRQPRPLSQREWQALKRRKISGYAFRTGAVIIWGIMPLYLKYTPAGTVEPFVRLYLQALGAFGTIALCIAIKSAITRNLHKLQVPWNIYFLNIIIGQALFLYFISASLLYTTSTNFAILSNFAPVLALLVAAMLWRHSIPYLHDPTHMLWIFLVFIMGSTGASLIIYNSFSASTGGSIFGDTLALSAMVADVLVITSQIRYMKTMPQTSSLSLNLQIFTFMTAALAPPVIFLALSGASSLTELGGTSLLFSIGMGALMGIGFIMNLEAFRRIEGFIAFLMFNVSILINFVAETFFLGTLIPTWILLFGGIVIIGSTILAELINTRCEQKGL